MKRVSDVFILPVRITEMVVDGAEACYATGEQEDCASLAINHADSLADALEGLLSRLHYEGCDFADMAVAGTALAKYRGEA